MKKYLAILLCVVLALCPLAAAAAPAANAPLLDGAKLVTFGDSITALSTWPYAVAKGANMHLYNEGIGGNTSAHGRDRFERDVLAHDPDFVIISFGTNDFYIDSGKTSARVSVTDYKANLTYFIDQVKAIGGTPILMTPPFLRSDALTGPNFAEGSPNKALDTYVNAMREVASQTSTHLIDIHTVCDNGGYDPSTFLKDDGIHLADQGNSVYGNAILSYLKDNFRQDPSAPRVTTNDPQPAAEGTWTKSLLSFDPDDWLVLFPGTAYGTENADGSVSFCNTNNEWPELHYSPRVCETFYAPVAGSYLTIDLELRAAANIYLHFNGPTPTCEYYYNAFALAPVLAKECPWVMTSGHDISGGQDIRCTIPLSAMVPQDYILADGTVLLSGVKLFVSGAKDTPVTINELSVTTTGGTAPAKFYADKQSLLPASASAVSQNEGVVDYTVNSNGSLTLNRSAQSELAWPSVKVSCGKTVDLHETPYLHLNVKTNGGTANGFLNYTDAHGKKGSIQLSKLVNGSENDFADTDIVVDLASAIQTGGTITIDNYVLSVCAVAGEGLTWAALSTACETSVDNILKGDMDGNGEISSTDARLLLLFIAQTSVINDQHVALYDINNDGAVNTSDVRTILKTVVSQ